jgi:hypothetical protein
MRFVDRDMMMRYLGLSIGHLNPINFPGDYNSLRPDVLIENNMTPWESSATGTESDRTSILTGESEEESAEDDNSEDGDGIDRDFVYNY